MKKIRLKYPLLVCAAGLLFGALPLWRGVPVWGDTLFHAMWYTNFSAQLLAGDVYPRWLINLNGGLGSPVFFYYAPLPYYITTLFAFLMPGGLYGTLHLGASAALAIIASGLTAYGWLKESAGARAAAAASVLYMLMPYHLAVDVYTRDAFAEVWAFVWMPLILYFVRRSSGNSDRSKFFPPGLALAYAALVTTHPPSTLIFSPIPLCYAFFTTEPQRRLRATLRTAGGMLLGAGLSSLYLLPAMLNQEFISLGDLLPGDYHQRWLRLTNFNLLLIEGRVTVAFLLTAGVVICAFIMSRGDGGTTATTEGNAGKRERLFWLSVVATCVLLMTAPGDFVWRIIKPLQIIQFPWRFNTVFCVAAAAIIANGVRAIPRTTPVGALRLAALVGACVLVLGWVVFTVHVARKEFPSLRRGSPAGTDAAYLKRLEQGRDAPEYRPADAASTQAGHFEQLLSRICREDGRLAKACVVEGAGTFTFERWQPREIRLRVETGGGVVFNVSQFYYPGWTAYVDGRRAHPLAPSQPDGLLHLALPPGTHGLTLRLEKTPPESIGQLVSAASLVVLLLWLAVGVPSPKTQVPGLKSDSLS
jgi:hypothetical protein